jgi:hypothetical protein
MKILTRVLMTLLVLVVAVPIVAVTGFIIWFHVATTGPDVPKEAKSAQVRHQRASAVTILDESVGTAESGSGPEFDLARLLQRTRLPRQLRLSECEA